MVRHAPRILSVKSESLNILREAAVARGSKVAARSIRWSPRSTLWAEVELAGVAGICIVVRVVDVLNEGLVRGRERPAQHRLMDEVHAELERMITGSPAQVVAHLVFVLIAQRRKQSDRGGELVVAESFKAGDGQRGRTEGKRQREA